MTKDEKDKIIREFGERLMQQPELNFDAAQEQRDAGIERVEAHATEDFKVVMLDAIHRLALSKEMLCSDDTWTMREKWPYTRDRRVLGALMQIAKRNGWIEPTDIFRPTAQVASHASPMRYWRSKIYRGGAEAQVAVTVPPREPANASAR